MLQCRPALRFVFLFAAGILLAEQVSIPPITLFSVILLILLLTAVLLLKKKCRCTMYVLLQGLIMLLGILLQTLQHLDFQSRELQPNSVDESVTLFGNIDSEAHRKDRKISCIIRTDSIYRERSIERQERRILLVLYLGKGESVTKEFEFGKSVEVQGSLEPFPFQRNPGEFDYGKYLDLNDIHGVVSLKGYGGVRLKERKSMLSPQSLIYTVQHTLYRIIDRLHSPKHASFLKGIIFGYSADLPPDVKQSFLDTGTIHILAVSGSNVAFVAMMFYSLFGFFRLPMKVVRCAAIAGLLLYMAVTGASPSVVRATIMAIVILCGTLFERKPDIYNSISVAAIILLLWNTNTLFDIGFQLSFSAVLSIVYFYPRLELLIKKIPERFEEIKAIEVLWKLFAVSLAAQIGTIPFTAYYFGRISIISLVANIPVVPISGLNTFIGFAEVFWYGISPWIANLYAEVNDFLVWFLLGFVQQAAKVSFAYIELWYLPAGYVLGYYFLVLSMFHLDRRCVRVWLLIIVLIIGNGFIILCIWSHRHEKMTVSMIDVGQGDAVLLECPNGKRILVDTGPCSVHSNAGERIILPFLKRQGIVHLDYLLITHPHSDHLGGASMLLRSILVDTLIMNSDDSDTQQVREILETAKEKHIGVMPAEAGSQIYIDQNIRMYVLNPEKEHSEEKNRNNISIVLKVLYADGALLLTGDAEVIVEKRMVSRYGGFLSSALLKVGHHGSYSSTSEDFLTIVHPSTALISVGTHNKFRHPSPWIIERLAARSVRMKRTDNSGAIIMENDGRVWTEYIWR
jgi:competence protein ComEC